jgi:hypothetical protein
MGIVSGIESLFFVLGVLSILSIMGLIYLNKKHHLKMWVLSLAGLGAFLFIFTIAWSGSSILEGESQAASMGLLCFGLPVLIIFGICRRLIARTQTE